MLIEIKTDPLFIGERLKEIDQSYYLVFNTIKNKYEVHSNEQKGCSYCLTCPNVELDERLVELVKKTRRENINELLSEIDKENERLEKEREKYITQRLEEK